MNKTKLISFIGALALIVAGVSACGQTAAAVNTGTTDRLKIVCTIFPEYDWVKQIMGDRAADADITYLLGSGTDMHNFQPTADDIIKICDCDLLMYVGGESDSWVDDAVGNAQNADMQTLSLLKAVGDSAKAEELKEGMEHEEEDHDHEDEEEIEYDEHVWLSVRNAKLICGQIADKLCALDAKNAETYRANLAAYSAELDKLDSDFKAVISEAPVKTVVFGDRFPFRYFIDDYGLDYYAAFAGCSAETEASFETIVFLANKVDELGVKTIYTIENSDGSIARTIINSTKNKDQSIAVLNSIQSVKSSDADAGATYISLMCGNLAVLGDTLK
ncbi:MAG: metal ABC transporter substrate-binding protein [Ruminiclostridium sp.]|nr:metal ABC transporter substrate-binding protein [Ruminiclostridium sp.]